jgi:hypothetical protein
LEGVRATVVQIRAQGGYQAETDNQIAMAFQVRDGDQLVLGDQLEVDLSNVVTRKTVVRVRDGKQLRIELREDDLHDMRLPVQHGGSRKPTAARLNEGSAG